MVNYFSCKFFCEDYITHNIHKRPTTEDDQQNISSLAMFLLTFTEESQISVFKYMGISKLGLSPSTKV